MSLPYATGIIREIVSDASQRFIICDPYLGAEDVKSMFYLFHTKVFLSNC